MNKSIVPITKSEAELIKKISSERKLVETKFPLLFGLTATFGLVSILYGFEKIIDKVSLFTEQPWILLVVGVLLLLATGAAYRKLN
jgi:hypothetical protein